MFRQKHFKRRSQAASGFASCDPKMVPYHGFPGIIQQPKTNLSSNMGLSENGVPLHPMVNDHYLY